MAKILERYSGTQYDKDGPGLVLITDAMPGWNQEYWRAAMRAQGISPDPGPFRPSFRLVFGFDSFTGKQWEMNPYWFADAPTATFIAQRYGNGKMRETDILGPGPYGVDHTATEFQLIDGRWVNAGTIAAFYERNPEDEFPGLADKLIKGILDKEAPPTPAVAPK